MSAPVGSTLKVSGSSIAMVAIGPTPGSTPISVPTRQPRKHSARLIGDSAVAKPSPRLPMRSNMARALNSREPGRERDRQPERELEQADAERRHERAEHDRFPPAHLVARERADHDGERAGDHQAERTHRQAECHDGAEHEQRARATTSARAAGLLPARRRRRAARPARRAAPQAPRQHAGPHAAERSDRQIGALPEREDCNRDDDEAADEILATQQRCQRSRVARIACVHDVFPTCPEQDFANPMPEHPVALVLLSQNAAGNGDQNQLLGEIHFQRIGG